MGQSPSLLPAGRGEGHGAVGPPRGGRVLRAGAQCPLTSPGAARHARAGHRSPARPAHGAPCLWRRLGASWRLCARPRPSPRPSTITRRLGQVCSFCHTISPSWARMTRPSPPPSAPWRSPRPAGMSSCTRWRTTASATPTRPRGLSSGDRLSRADRGVLRRARRHERFGQAVLPAVDSRAYLAACHAELGTFAEGRALGDEGLRIAEAVDHPASLMVALWGIGLLALRQGDLPRALPRLERAWTSVRSWTCRAGFPGWLRPWVRPIPWPGVSPTPCRCSRRRWNRPTAKKESTSGALSSLPGGGAAAGRSPGGGAGPRRAGAGACP